MKPPFAFDIAYLSSRWANSSVIQWNAARLNPDALCKLGIDWDISAITDRTKWSKLESHESSNSHDWSNHSIHSNSIAHEQSNNSSSSWEAYYNYLTPSNFDLLVHLMSWRNTIHYVPIQDLQLTRWCQFLHSLDIKRPIQVMVDSICLAVQKKPRFERPALDNRRFYVSITSNKRRCQRRTTEKAEPKLGYIIKYIRRYYEQIKLLNDWFRCRYSTTRLSH